MFCQHCGNPVTEPEVQAESAVEETALVVSSDVEIARINAERDIKLAKINAGIVESEAVIVAAAAEAEADALHDVLTPPEPEPAEPMVIVDAPVDVDASQEPSPLDVPLADDSAPSEVREEKPKKSSGYGSSAWFGG